MKPKDQKARPDILLSGRPTGEKRLSLHIIENAGGLYQKGRLADAFNTLIEGIKQMPCDEAIYLSLAEILTDSGNFNDALEVLNGMPGSDDIAWLEISARCKEGLGLYKEAEYDADRALELNPLSAAALNLKGTLAHKREDAYMAEFFFRKAIESAPEFGESYTNLGVVLWSSGKKDDGLDLIEKGFVLSPAVTDIAVVYHSVIEATGNYARAEPVFRQARERYPINRKINSLLADALLKVGQYYEALNECESALVQFGPDDEIISTALSARNILGPLKIANTDKTTTLSLCMIAKNEENRIADCIASVKKAVDEMIVVDTGSTDRTENMAKALGAKIYNLEWADDFSEARNFSLSQAAGDMILVLDADEVIASQDIDSLASLVKKREQAPAAYSLTTRNYTYDSDTMGWTPNDGEYADEEAGNGWLPSIKVRIFPNDIRIRFEYPVHELVENSIISAGITIEKCNVPVHHYGKVDKKKDISKGEAYYSLGKKKLAEKEDDIKALSELAVVAGGLGKYNEAIELWERVINISPDTAFAFYNLGGIYLRLGKYDRALASSKRALELSPELKDVLFNYSLSEFYAGDVIRAIATLEGMVRQGPEYPPYVALLSAAYYIDGNNEKGAEYAGVLTKMGFDYAAYFRSYSHGLVATGRPDQAEILIEIAAESREKEDKIRAFLSDCKKTGLL